MQDPAEKLSLQSHAALIFTTLAMIYAKCLHNHVTYALSNFFSTFLIYVLILPHHSRYQQLVLASARMQEEQDTP